MKTRMRRAGAMTTALGLVLTVVGVVATSTPAAAVADTSGLVCNNQKDRADQDCEGVNRHGTVAASFDGGGNLVFDVTGDAGFVGWRQLYVCIPGTAKTNGADCQGNTASVLDPRPAPGGAYDVTVPAANTENSKDVTFACSPQIEFVVDASALPDGPNVAWTIHVNTCDGGTDEAFGVTERPAPPGDFSYACSPASDVGQTVATLNATTDDEDITDAVFTLRAAGEADRTLTDDDAADGFSAVVTALTPNTAYTYTVDFFAAEAAEPTATSSGCAFTTSAAPDTYGCVAPTGVTATGATLRAATSNGEIDAVTFALSPADGAVAAGAEDGVTGQWSATATDLQPATAYTYTATFTDAADVAGTAGGPTCAFTTAAVAGAADAAPEPVAEEPAVVAGVVETRPAVAAEAATLPRTGFSTEGLLSLGLTLVVVGFAAITMSARREPQLVLVAGLLRRPSGRHYR